jgi:phosphoglycerate dehydrogenase-like enzyme
MSDNKAARPLTVAVLHAPGTDPKMLEAGLRRAGRPLNLRFMPYFDPDHVRRLKATRPLTAEERQQESPLTDAQKRQLLDVDVLLSTDLPVDAGTLMPRLRWMHALTAGTDHLVRLLPKGVVLTTSSGASAQGMAEFIFARLLEIWKHLRTIETQQREKVWQKQFGRTLAGNTIGIVGYGAIGQATARLAKAFGLQVIGIRRNPSAGDPTGMAERIGGPADLPWLLGAADIVVLSAPDSAESQNLMGAAQFAAMRHGSVFCNVARGSLVDEDALVAALRSGQVGAAILDVMRQEPPPPDSPLWDTPNLYLSPHCSVATDTYFERVLDIFIDNLDRDQRGDTLRNLVAT